MEKSSLFHALVVYLQESTPVSIEKEAGWNPEPVWIFWKTEKYLTPKSVSSQDVRSRRRILVWSKSPCAQLIGLQYFRKSVRQRARL